MPRLVLALFLGLALASAPAAAAAERVDAGPLSVTVEPDPWRIAFGQRGGPALAGDPALALGFRSAAGWQRATRAAAVRRAGAALEVELDTTDAAGRRIAVRIAPDADGVLSLTARVSGATGDVTHMGLGFAAAGGERFLGFGERSNAVDQRGKEVESYVGEGAYPPEERPFIQPFVPAWSMRHRDDATYFPMPWLVSTRGYGVLLDNTETSLFRLGTERADAWSAEVEATELALRVFAGPTPAAVVRRLGERVGRQPAPAAPWFYGPWFHTGQANEVPLDQERRFVRLLRDANAPASAAETHMRYLPCGAHEGRRDRERARTSHFHTQGLASLTYVQEKICTSYRRGFDEARRRDALARNQAGQPYLYNAYYGAATPPTAVMSLIDFSAPGAQGLYDLLLKDPVDDGHDGWMEDFGESVPPDARFANGEDGRRMHNRYPVLYHRAAHEFAARAPRPLARFARSGWTGVHPYVPIVWGGDPATDWGYDGLESAVKNALTMGLSGISTWGSDIGGFFSLGQRRTTPELLIRWIEFGAVSTVMRTKHGGVAVPPKERPQPWDREILPHWRRWARLHTQLHPYLVAADARYRRTGMPVMAHLALVDPRDERAAAREDEFMFGPHLLAAPVLRPGERRRQLYLPRGAWIDLWRATRYEPGRGGLRLGGARVHRGGRRMTLPAPLGELPLLVRAGAVLPLLSPDVDTLAPYGGGTRGVVRLDDRRDRLELIAFPRGRTRSRFNTGEWVDSIEGRRRWTLAVRGTRRRTYRLQATLATLRRPFRLCTVTLGGRRLPRRAWRHDRRRSVLRATFRTRSGTLRVRACR